MLLRALALNSAACLLKLGRWREAREACGEALATDPRNAKAQRTGKCSSEGSAPYDMFPQQMHLCSGSLMVLTIHTKKCFLGAGFLGAPPTSVKGPLPAGHGLPAAGGRRGRPGRPGGGPGGGHRWNRNPRPQTQRISKLVFIIEFS